ncbi:4'-phosphopantetheinyl transferase, partial [Paenibacillus macerans]
GLMNGLDCYDVTQNLRFLKKHVQFTSVDYFKRLIQICHMSKHSLNFEVVPLTQLL